LLDTVGHNLLHALQWELNNYRIADKQKRWDLTEKEAEAVDKWIDSRINELLTKREY